MTLLLPLLTLLLISQGILGQIHESLACDNKHPCQNRAECCNGMCLVSGEECCSAQGYSVICARGQKCAKTEYSEAVCVSLSFSDLQQLTRPQSCTDNNSCNKDNKEGGLICHKDKQSSMCISEDQICGSYYCVLGQNCLEDSERPLCYPQPRETGQYRCSYDHPCPTGQECCEYEYSSECVEKGKCLCGKKACDDGKFCDKSGKEPTCEELIAANWCDDGRSCSKGQQCCTMGDGLKICAPSDQQCCGSSLCGRKENCVEDQNGEPICVSQAVEKIDKLGNVICKDQTQCPRGSQCCSTGGNAYECANENEFCCPKGGKCEVGKACGANANECIGQRLTVKFCQKGDPNFCSEEEDCCFGGEDGWSCIPKGRVCCGGYSCSQNETCYDDGCQDTQYTVECPNADVCGEGRECCVIEDESNHKQYDCRDKGDVCCNGASCPSHRRCAFDGHAGCVLISETPCPEAGICGDGKPCCKDPYAMLAGRERKYCPPHGKTCLDQ